MTLEEVDLRPGEENSATAVDGAALLGQFASFLEERTSLVELQPRPERVRPREDRDALEVLAPGRAGKRQLLGQVMLGIAQVPDPVRG